MGPKISGTWEEEETQWIVRERLFVLCMHNVYLFGRDRENKKNDLTHWPDFFVLLTVNLFNLLNFKSWSNRSPVLSSFPGSGVTRSPYWACRRAPFPQCLFHLSSLSISHWGSGKGWSAGGVGTGSLNLIRFPGSRLPACCPRWSCTKYLWVLKGGK